MDNTFHSIVIFSGAATYYRHPENGGTTQSIVEAQHFRNIDIHLAQGMAYAKQHYPTHAWFYGRFNFTVERFSHSLDIMLKEDQKRQALAKLTPADREVLGLTP